MFPFFKNSIHRAQRVKREAYIPPEREPICLGASRWFRTPTRRFGAAYINMLVSKDPSGPNGNPYGALASIRAC